MQSSQPDEQEAFDNQIVERKQHGHIADLRLAPKCDYFYNNSWRHPGYVKLDFTEQFELINQIITDYIEGRNLVKVLEVGCGPGWLSLELARNGRDVVGIDLSEECIAEAKNIANDDPWKSERSNLSYLHGDFFSHPQLQPNRFDVVIFLSSLHHFVDQRAVMERVRELLTPCGIVIAHEPTRDRMTEGNAVFIYLVRLLLSVGKGFYKEVKIPTDFGEQTQVIKKLLNELKYKDEKNNNIQSVNDNAAGYKEMYEELSGWFEEIMCKDRYAFFHELIGGLRFDEQTNLALAKYIRDVDARLCDLGVLAATEFVFVGRNTKYA